MGHPWGAAGSLFDMVHAPSRFEVNFRLIFVAKIHACFFVAVRTQVLQPKMVILKRVFNVLFNASAVAHVRCTSSADP